MKKRASDDDAAANPPERAERHCCCYPRGGTSLVTRKCVVTNIITHKPIIPDPLIAKFLFSDTRMALGWLAADGSLT